MTMTHFIAKILRQVLWGRIADVYNVTCMQFIVQFSELLCLCCVVMWYRFGENHNITYFSDLYANFSIEISAKCIHMDACFILMIGGLYRNHEYLQYNETLNISPFCK